MPNRPAAFNIDSSGDGGNPSSALLSVKQASVYLNMSEGWLYQSGIPFVRFGRRRLYRITDLDAAIERNTSHGAKGPSV